METRKEGETTAFIRVEAGANNDTGWATGKGDKTKLVRIKLHGSEKCQHIKVYEKIDDKSNMWTNYNGEFSRIDGDIYYNLDIIWLPIYVKHQSYGIGTENAPT